MNNPLQLIAEVKASMMSLFIIEGIVFIAGCALLMLIGMAFFSFLARLIEVFAGRG
mgnify:CR=1 FL=1